MNIDVLAIGAHPDDIELSCGGTIIKLVRQGHRVGIVDVTQGELGTRGSGEIRAEEARVAAELMGVHYRTNLLIGDGNIEKTQDNVLRLVRVLRAVRPQVLLIPHSTDRHPDHETAHALCRKAWFDSGLRRIETTLDGAPQEAFRPRALYHYMQWHEFTPSFIVDVSETYETRVAAMRAYRSQFYDPENNEPGTVLSSPEFTDTIRTRLEYYGDKIGTKYGEPFLSPAPIAIGDIFTLNT
jgi:bacillithiol biosynthesis deacetylase BshB1